MRKVQLQTVFIQLWIMVIRVQWNYGIFEGDCKETSAKLREITAMKAAINYLWKIQYAALSGNKFHGKAFISQAENNPNHYFSMCKPDVFPDHSSTENLTEWVNRDIFESTLHHLQVCIELTLNRKPRFAFVYVKRRA